MITTTTRFNLIRSLLEGAHSDKSRHRPSKIRHNFTRSSLTYRSKEISEALPKGADSVTIPKVIPSAQRANGSDESQASEISEASVRYVIWRLASYYVGRDWRGLAVGMLQHTYIMYV